MINLEKMGNGEKKEVFLSNLIWLEKFRRLRKKIFSIPFLTMLGIWIIAYFQFTSHFHHPENGYKNGEFFWKTFKIVQK